MAAARTIPDTHKRFTSMALIMSYKIVATKAPLRRARTAEAEKVFRPQAIHIFALVLGRHTCAPLTITSYVNLLNFRHRRGRINSYLIVVWTACRRPTWSDRPSRWRLDACLCAV